ncbi:Ger(x)C family spore germination protein [Ectobacillus sp. JY-23]|uniref:Ger(x)C family spore germination protein n=1 Tax=Ectobacillus sp. JY-23 TaxID=2933872 RepID=UPI001FF615FD|nr:Ger(x)C family spore germination protein [Ectobacillus sp. JY-23]UOY91854.1 Ger(x)C family spore germination protein [Ectobacillus sp. JY-23]
MLKRIMGYIALICMLIYQAGCGSQAELNEMAVVIGMGIDIVNEHQYKVTFQIVDPSQAAGTQGGSGGNSGLQILNQSGFGKTIVSAARNASKSISRQNFYAHTALIVFGEEMARRGLAEALDTLERDQSLRTNIPVVIARDTTASTVLDTLTVLNKIPTQSIIGKLKNTGQVLGENPNVLLNELVMNTVTPGKEAIISGVTVKGDTKKKSQASYVEQTHPVSSVLSGVGILNKQGRLVRWLDGTDAKAVLYIGNQLKHTIVSAACAKNKYISSEILFAKSKKKVSFQQGTPILHVSVYQDAEIEAVDCEDVAITNPDVIKQIETKMSKEVKREIEHAVRLVQQEKSDIFGFGEFLYRNSPRVWNTYEKQWEEQFAKAKLHVTVHTTLRRSGMIQDHFPTVR